jgi:hypothetical protein
MLSVVFQGCLNLTLQLSAANRIKMRPGTRPGTHFVGAGRTAGIILSFTRLQLHHKIFSGFPLNLECTGILLSA